jgi:hypothetical protein
VTGGAGGGGGVGGAPPSPCAVPPRSLQRLPPEILIVLDASRSMNDDLANMSCGADGCGATSKWAQLTPAVSQLGGEAPFRAQWGLVLFSSDETCSVGTVPDVGTDAGHAQRISTALARRTSASGGVANAGYTPTRAALDLANASLSGRQTGNHKYIALVTDGAPTCPVGGAATEDDTQGALAAARRAHGIGLPVFVIGVAIDGAVTNGVDVRDALGQLAMAGGRPRAGELPYYPVANASQLWSALRAVEEAAQTCTFEIGPPPGNDGTASNAYIDVFVDGRKVPRDTTRSNGWDYDDATLNVITVYGDACRPSLGAGGETVSVTFRCILI